MTPPLIFLLSLRFHVDLCQFFLYVLPLDLLHFLIKLGLALSPQIPLRLISQLSFLLLLHPHINWFNSFPQELILRSAVGPRGLRRHEVHKSILIARSEMEPVNDRLHFVRRHELLFI